MKWFLSAIDIMSDNPITKKNFALHACIFNFNTNFSKYGKIW